MEVGISLGRGADFAMVLAWDQDGSGSRRIMKVSIPLGRGADSYMVQAWDEDGTVSRRII